MAIAKKTVLITGCGDAGIGSGLAIAFNKRGYHVFATARNTAKMSDLQDLSDITFLKLDVTNKDSIAAAAEEISAQTGGKLDVLVNNAARGYNMPLLDEDLDNARNMFDTNVWGCVAVVQGFIQLLIKARGTAVFISSVAGYLTMPCFGTYGASKAALEHIAGTLRLELEPFGVRVLSIVSGAVKTNGPPRLQQNFKLPEDSLYKPLEESIINRTNPEADLMEYSNAVVAKIVGGASGQSWHGYGAGFVKFAVLYLRSFSLVKLLTKDFGLDKVAAAQQKKE